VIRISAAGVVLAALVLLAVGTLVGVFVFPVTAPPDIAATAKISSVPATQLDITDDQDATLAITATPERKVAAGMSGTVTATSCASGGRAISGRAGFSINDVPIVYLSTPSPLWRDLVIGDQGVDVESLQNELKRLGQEVQTDGRFGSDTLRAVVSVAKDAGVSEARAWKTFPVSRFAWLPGPEVETIRCSAQVGDQIAAGGEVAALPPGIAAAKLNVTPSDAVSGSRVVVVGDLVLPVDESGVISSPNDLAKLSASPAYAKYVGDGSTSTAAGGHARNAGAASDGISVTFRLAKPLKVYSIPAAAVYAVTGQKACVVAAGRPVAVTIASSQYGQTLVRVESGKRIVKVALDTSQARPCR